MTHLQCLGWHVSDISVEVTFPPRSQSNKCIDRFDDLKYVFRYNVMVDKRLSASLFPSTSNTRGLDQTDSTLLMLRPFVGDSRGVYN